MNCKQGDIAKVIAPAPMELRGTIVQTRELVYSFRDGSVEPAWIVDRRVRFVCSNCGMRHTTDRFLDAELQPLPDLPPEETEEHENELTTV